MHAEFLQAFAHALHGVFLWGMAIAVIPFVLSWFLKEMPLRTTLAHQSSELAARRPWPAATPPEELVERLARSSLPAVARDREATSVRA